MQQGPGLDDFSGNLICIHHLGAEFLQQGCYSIFPRGYSSG